MWVIVVKQRKTHMKSIIQMLLKQRKTHMKSIIQMLLAIFVVYIAFCHDVYSQLPCYICHDWMPYWFPWFSWFKSDFVSIFLMEAHIGCDWCVLRKTFLIFLSGRFLPRFSHLSTIYFSTCFLLLPARQ